jgi:uncharacterized protein (TIGR02145 family)
MKEVATTFTALLFALSVSFGQTRINFDLGKSCSYYGENITDDIYSFTSIQEAKDIVARIVNVVGLEQNFQISAANVPNAMAIIEYNQRLILYSQNFILNIKNATGTDWAGISILAHEIGHHLNGHTIMPGGSRPDLELQADKFSGFACAKLGATLQQAQAAMNSFASSSGSSTHPPRSARIEAIALGWTQGNSGRVIKTPPEKPSSTESLVTVQIGSQKWSKRNLNVDHFANGDAIPEVSGDEEWKRVGKSKQPASCYYMNDPANGKIYGKLYNVYAVADPRGLCPTGWHVPSAREWKNLEDYLGSSGGGIKLKSSDLWSSGKGDDNYGFAAVPGGERSVLGKFRDIGTSGIWWSSSTKVDYNYVDAEGRMLTFLDDDFSEYGIISGGQGVSVRCIKD